MRTTAVRMASDHPSAATMDPAYTAYTNMMKNRYKYFRWTPRTAWLTFAYVVAVPAVFGYIGFMTDGKYDMRGKRRGDIISEF